MSSTTPRTDSQMRRADSMMPNAVVVSAPTARGLETDLEEALREIERLRGALLTGASLLEQGCNTQDMAASIRRVLNVPNAKVSEGENGK